MIMGAIITDYTLKSYIRQIVRDTTNRNTVISRLWEWIYHPNIRDPLPEVDTDSLLDLLVTEFGSEAVKDRGIVDDILVGFYCDVDGDDTINMDESELKVAEWRAREDVELQPDDYSLTNEMMKMFKEH